MKLAGWLAPFFYESSLDATVAKLRVLLLAFMNIAVQFEESAGESRACVIFLQKSWENLAKEDVFHGDFTKTASSICTLQELPLAKMLVILC